MVFRCRQRIKNKYTYEKIENRARGSEVKSSNQVERQALNLYVVSLMATYLRPVWFEKRHHDGALDTPTGPAYHLNETKDLSGKNSQQRARNA